MEGSGAEFLSFDLLSGALKMGEELGDSVGVRNQAGGDSGTPQTVHFANRAFSAM